jgi:hypothetical protein
MSADGAVSARSSSSSSLQAGEDEKRPVSIAALRSKFENLAAGGDGNAAEGGSHSRRGSQTQGLGVKKVDTSSNVLVNGSVGRRDTDGYRADVCIDNRSSEAGFAAHNADAQSTISIFGRAVPAIRSQTTSSLTTPILTRY